MSGTYDPEQAQRGVHELAAVPDAELAADIRGAYANLVDLGEQRRQAGGWPSAHWDRVAYAALLEGRDALAGVPDDARWSFWKERLPDLLASGGQLDRRKPRRWPPQSSGFGSPSRCARLWWLAAGGSLAGE
ncbi:hypothetical protein ACQPYA_04335 [Micromonospora sp. CA-263727]|uniref:hypothetical protein n=1 Tax=Micromonospora sp. CA-263727 TaxID=3239967 RepID=UPI003D8FE5C7